MTPLYKARFEELSDQAQVVVSAIASIWEPATSARICERTRLQNSQVSTNLDRLKKAGIIEEVIVDPDERVGPLPAMAPLMRISRSCSSSRLSHEPGCL